MPRWKLPSGHTFIHCYYSLLSTLVSTRDYFKYAALHRFRACSRTDMLANILDQELDYLHEARHSIGLAHLMHRETDRMQSIVNESLPRLLFGSISLVAGIHALM